MGCENEKSEKKARKPWLTILLALAILLIVGLIAAYSLRKAETVRFVKRVVENLAVSRDVYCRNAEIVWQAVQTLGVLAALFYFTYRFLTGYFIPNLIIAVECSRVSIKGTHNDHLVVVVKLEKGDRFTLRLHDAQVRVSEPGRDDKPKPLIGYERLKRDRSPNNPKIEVVDFKRPEETVPWLNLAPGEKTQFARGFEVSNNAICTVEVVLLCGYIRAFHKKFGQWRASAISTPQTKPNDRPVNGP
jgi:hypothetical protein